MHVHERQWGEKKTSKEQGKLEQGMREEKIPPNPFSDFSKLVCRKTGDTEIIQTGKQ